jgi:DNA-binding MarR family transcriptional regulator
MAYRYTINFTTSGIDESALREAIEQLGPADIAVSRVPIALEAVAVKPGFWPTKTQATIIAALKDNRPHRKSEIIDAVQGKRPSAVTNALDTLVAAGQARRFRHGIYGSMLCSEVEAAALPPRLNKTTNDSTFGQVVRTVKESPSTMVQLRQQFGVSRQRIEQILSKAERLKLVQRVEAESGERGQYIYLAPDAKINEIMGRKPIFVESRKKLLSAMSAGKLYYATELAAFLERSTNTTFLKEALAGLAKWGLVYTMEIGVKMFCGVTPAGVTHEDYDLAAPKANPVDFIAEIGEIKSIFLQALRVLGGSARTIELTYAIGEDIFESVGYSSGQVMQRLELSGLVQRTKRKGEQVPHSLTKTGQYVASLVDQFIPPPAAAELRARIARRMEEKAEKLRGREWDGGYSLPPTYRAILAVVTDAGEIATPGIPEKMAVRFVNPRSINLAMKTLEERGYVKRVRKHPRDGNVWSVTEKGLQEMRPQVDSSEIAAG